MNTTLLLDHGPAATGGWVVRALLRIEGVAPPNTDRAPLNLALVLDRSGSMEGEKLEAARAAASHLVRRLAAGDRIAVVGYDDQVRTYAHPQNASNADVLQEAIDAIEAGGSTNLSGGWLRGCELVAAGRQERGIHRVLLLTDGLANVGVTQPEQLRLLVGNGREKGVTTTTIGFGEDYDEDLLGALADAGGGNTYYIEEPDQAPAIFGAEIEGLLGVCAQNIVVTFEPAPAATLSAVHHGYPSQRNDDRLRLEVGDLYANEPRPLLLEMLVDTPPSSEELLVGTLVVEGMVVVENGALEMRSIRLPILLDASAGAHTEPEVQRELLLLQAAKARQEALELEQQGDAEAAGAMLMDLSAAYGALDIGDSMIQEEAADLAYMADKLVARCDAADVKYMKQRVHDATRGRRANSSLIARTQKPRPPQ